MKTCYRTRIRLRLDCPIICISVRQACASVYRPSGLADATGAPRWMPLTASGSRLFSTPNVYPDGRYFSHLLTRARSPCGPPSLRSGVRRRLRGLSNLSLTDFVESLNTFVSITTKPRTRWGSVVAPKARLTANTGVPVSRSYRHSDPMWAHLHQTTQNQPEYDYLGFTQQ